MRVLGIDPGLAIVGYGIIDHVGSQMKVVDYGKIITTPDERFPTRLSGIYHAIKVILERYEPDAVAIEELFFAKNVTTGIQVGHARGVLVLAANEYGVDLYEYTPKQIKQAITGYGAADKKQMQQMTKLLLGLEEVPKPDDVADALAVAIAHGQTGAFSEEFRI
ncbi:MAG: crossover junction endodeoxyribonuclease RuvC [Tissierellia bacterium]|nr:crossover junction endodeoxyribonuclease RuvC [Tissierellia bacterium]